MGGILDSAGVPGFLDDRHAPVEAADPEEAAWQAFVARWAEVHGTSPVGGRELLVLAAEVGLWESSPQVGASELTRFGLALSKRRDRVFSGYRLVLGRDAKRKVNQYALRPVGGAS